MDILITGGAGFIGSALINYILEETNDTVICVDKLTYAANLDNVKQHKNHKRFFFEKVDICDENSIRDIFFKYQPQSIMHLAAESHVDNSINEPSAFIETNIVGTYVLLKVANDYWHQLAPFDKDKFRFQHISTDEVYGDLGYLSSNKFSEQSPYQPSSPYSASKASSDHLVRAWHRTYGIPVVITNCSNNYGPYQNTEKFIPTIIKNALLGKDIPIYGNGKQIRDWLYVNDHVNALYMVLKQGKIGETYNIGGDNEKTNIELAMSICALLEERLPVKPNGITNYADLIKYVKDRPGHDLHYAIDASKIKTELGWSPQESFLSGMKKTVNWYIQYYSIKFSELNTTVF